MMKMLLYRVLPLGAAIGIFSSALSPLQPMLAAFGKAATALTGDTDVGGVDLQPPDLQGELNKVKEVAKGPQQSKQGRTLQQLADNLSQGKATVDADDPYGHKAGARGMKKLDLPPPPKKKKR